jgi:hypothetical protein
LRPELRDILLLALVVGIACWLLFVPPIIGLADQADFGRVMQGAGIDYPDDTPVNQRFFCYVQQVYKLVPPAAAPFASTESIFITLALGLNRLAGNRAVFDIRALGAVHLAALALVLWFLLVLARKLGPAARNVFAIMVVLIACDIGYLAWFHSMYLEPATYIFGLLFIGSVVLYCSAKAPTPSHLAFSILALLLLAGAKSQNLPLLAAGLVFLIFSASRLTPAFNARWSAVWSAAALLVCLFVASAAQNAGVSDRVKRMNLYNSIFLQAVAYSPSAAADLRALGLEPDLVRYAGTSVFDPGVPFYDLTKFPGKASYARLVWFYLRRPVQLIHLTMRGLAESLSNRVYILGNYTSATGQPCQARSSSFAVWDTLRGSLRTPWIVVPLLLLNFFVPLVVSFRAADRRVSVLLQFHATVAAMAVLSFYAAILADGNEFQKHLFPFNFLCDCLLAADILWLMEAWRPIAAGVRGLAWHRLRAPLLIGGAFAAGSLAGDLSVAPPTETIPAGSPVAGFVDVTNHQNYKVTEIQGNPSLVSVSAALPVEIRGWSGCADPRQKAESVELMVDRSPVAKAELSLARPDVAAAYGRLDFSRSGWRAALPAETLQPGSHMLNALVTCTGGAAGVLPPLTLVVSR